MPAVELMSWNSKQKRWFKWRKGTTIAVSARQLGCPPSREHSREAANAWWRAKEDELRARADPKPHEDMYRLVIDTRRRMAQWFREHLEQDPRYQEGMARQEVEAARLQEILDTEDNPPPLTKDDYPMMFDMNHVERAVWLDRLKHDHKDPAPNDRRIGYWVERWLEAQRARAKAQEIAPDRYGCYRYTIEYFRKWAGTDNDIETITFDLAERYHHHLLDLVAKRHNASDSKEGCSGAYAKERLDAFKQLCRWLSERDLIPLPKNVANPKTLRIKAGNGKREMYPIGDIKSILADAETPERSKLFILLMLNCGMYQSDIARLDKSQVNLAKRRIERKRSKTEQHPNVPVVNYLLWKKTANLLEKFIDTDDGNPLALLNEEGKPLQAKFIGEDGKAKRVCNITTAYKRLKARLGISHPLAQLRKTSANLLYNSKQYRPFHFLFLGHAPRSVAERFYVSDKKTTLDHAIRWLGKQLGIE